MDTSSNSDYINYLNNLNKELTIKDMGKFDATEPMDKEKADNVINLVKGFFEHKDTSNERDINIRKVESRTVKGQYRVAISSDDRVRLQQAVNSVVSVVNWFS